MKRKLFICFTLFIFSLSSSLRADIGMYDSVEWLTAMADQVGVYQVERIYGPHSVTNDPHHWSCCSCTANFKLQQSLRGSPPATFSRTRPVDKPEQLSFQSGGTYIFFMVANERLKTVPVRNEPPEDVFFSMWDYIWLERPPGERNGVAIDHRGVVLTNQAEIVKLVQDSLKLPRAGPGIDRWAYFYGGDKSMYPNGTNFNFRVINFPLFVKGNEKEGWANAGIGWQGLVIPECLYEGETNQPANAALKH